MGFIRHEEGKCANLALGWASTNYLELCFFIL